MSSGRLAAVLAAGQRQRQRSTGAPVGNVNWAMLAAAAEEEARVQRERGYAAEQRAAQAEQTGKEAEQRGAQANADAQEAAKIVDAAKLTAEAWQKEGAAQAQRWATAQAEGNEMVAGDAALKSMQAFEAVKTTLQMVEMMRVRAWEASDRATKAHQDALAAAAAATQAHEDTKAAHDAARAAATRASEIAAKAEAEAHLQ